MSCRAIELTDEVFGTFALHCVGSTPRKQRRGPITARAAVSMFNRGYNGRNGDCSLMYNLEQRRRSNAGAVAKEATTKYTEGTKGHLARTGLRLASLVKKG